MGWCGIFAVDGGGPAASLRLDRPMSPLPMCQPESQAWTAVSRRLRRCALGVCGNTHDADDLVQQAFAAILARAPEKIEHYGYARATLVRLWLDRQRSGRRRLARLARLLTTRGHWSVDPDRTGDAERIAAVRGAIAGLPPRQRAVLVLRLVEELEYPAIAEALGCPVQTVRANLHRARAALRRALGDEP
jgi:RNA polymerase sigma factor (sigma-70 family)